MGAVGSSGSGSGSVGSGSVGSSGAGAAVTFMFISVEPEPTTLLAVRVNIDLPIAFGTPFSLPPEVTLTHEGLLVSEKDGEGLPPGSSGNQSRVVPTCTVRE